MTKDIESDILAGVLFALWIDTQWMSIVEGSVYILRKIIILGIIYVSCNIFL